MENLHGQMGGSKRTHEGDESVGASTPAGSKHSIMSDSGPEVEDLSRGSLRLRSTVRVTEMSNKTTGQPSPVSKPTGQTSPVNKPTGHPSPEKKKKRSEPKWSCFDNCVWGFGMFSLTSMLMLFGLQLVPRGTGTDYLLKLTGSPLPESPGKRLAREGLRKHHPLVLVPGIVTGGLELWQGRECAEGMFRERIWGGTFVRALQRPGCWMEHMMMDNETGLDPTGIRVRPVSGLVAADYFMPGYFVWAPLIESLAQVGYDERSLHMAAYDWRISFQNTEIRDRTMTRLKSAIETLKVTNDNKKVVVVPHSMGALMFYFFMNWVETPAPLGGGGGPTWVNDHVAACINIGPPFLGVPKAVAALLSGEMRDMAELRAMAPFLAMSPFGRHTLIRLMSMLRSWDSIASMLPKGGDAVWGGMDWSPEEGYPAESEEYIGNVYDGLESKEEKPPPKLEDPCTGTHGDAAKDRHSETCKRNLDGPVTESGSQDHAMECKATSGNGGGCESRHCDCQVNERKVLRLRKRWSTIGRIIAFGKDEALKDLGEEDIQNIEKAGQVSHRQPEADNHEEEHVHADCEDAWTEYVEMTKQMKKTIVSRKIYTVSAALDLLHEVAPRLMKRVDKSWSMGLARNVSEPKYAEDPRYWGNALESKLPAAPDMTMYCMYGVGKLTERAYVYAASQSNDSCTIPFHIETAVDSLFSRETEDMTPQTADKTVVKYGVQLTDGDGTVPLISNGFMCARGWRGKTQFNPAGVPVYTREYKHIPPGSLLEGRGHLSGDHVDVMGNFLLLEDIIRIATGSSGEDLGGDQIHSDIMEIAKHAQVPL